MLNNKDDGLVECPADHFVRDEDAARFDVLDGVRPSVFVDGDGVGLQMDRDLGLRQERILRADAILSRQDGGDVGLEHVAHLLLSGKSFVVERSDGIAAGKGRAARGLRHERHALG